MTVRSLNGLNGTSTGVVITNRMEAQLPLEQTDIIYRSYCYVYERIKWLWWSWKSNQSE